MQKYSQKCGYFCTYRENQFVPKGQIEMYLWDNQFAPFGHILYIHKITQ